MTFWDDKAHVIAFKAYIKEARLAGKEPESEKVKQQFYRMYESDLKNDWLDTKEDWEATPPTRWAA